MSFTELHIEDFRNIEKAQLSLTDGVNLVVGPNGSGKSSVLEALYVLGRARSFRASQLGQLIRQGEAAFLARGRLTGVDGSNHHIGVRKQRGHKGLETRLDGVDLSSREPVSRLAPVILINSDSYRLVEGGPKYRRQFVDWGMFHVEHSGREAWRAFRRALKQRNSALRGPSSQLSLWSDELADRGVELDCERRKFIDRINPLIEQQLQQLLGSNASLDYRVGWRDREGLRQALEQSVPSDRQAGFTKTGPHRANVVATVNGLNSRERLSRGQEKLMVFGLMIALIRLLKEERSVDSILLVDDMAAELDDDNQAKVLEALTRLNTQLFVTGTDIPAGVKRLPLEPKVFHVKHGTVSEG